MSTKTGKFGGEATVYEGTNSPFLAWQIAMVKVGSKVFPITATTGVGGSEAAAVYNLGHNGFKSAVSYVYRNIVRAVMVDSEGRSGVEYTLDVAMRSFGSDEVYTMPLNQRSRFHTLCNKQAAARTIAELIINAAINGYYAFLSNAGWKAAAEDEAPEALVEKDDADIAF